MVRRSPCIDGRVFEILPAGPLIRTVLQSYSGKRETTGSSPVESISGMVKFGVHAGLITQRSPGSNPAPAIKGGDKMFGLGRQNRRGRPRGSLYQDNALRQRLYRKNHPRTFNMVMARCYLRKLEQEDRELVLKQLEGEDESRIERQGRGLSD